MSADHQARLIRWSAVAAALSLIAALMYLILFRIADSTEQHAFNRGWLPPEDAALTSGQRYQLSVRGGVDALAKRGVTVTSTQCSWSSDGSTSQPLAVTPLARDSHALNVVAVFVAPISGPVHVECAKWGPVSIDDSDDSGVDVAGFFVLLAIGCLVSGSVLGLSVLHRRSTGPGGRHTLDDVAAPIASG